MEMVSRLAIVELITIIGVSVGIIGIIVGIIGIASLSSAKKLLKSIRESANPASQPNYGMANHMYSSSGGVVRPPDPAPYTSAQVPMSAPLTHTTAPSPSSGLSTAELNEMMQSAMDSDPVEIEASRYLALSEEEKRGVFYIIIPDKS